MSRMQGDDVGHIEDGDKPFFFRRKWVRTFGPSAKQEVTGPFDTTDTLANAPRMRSHVGPFSSIALAIACGGAREPLPPAPLPPHESPFFPPEAPACDPATLQPLLTTQSPAGPRLTPFAFVTPIYPAEARLSRSKGWVELDFTVSTRGHVCDVSVVEARPVGVFDASAMEAVQKWRYRPTVVNRQPRATAGVTTRIVFDGEQARIDPRR